MTRHDDSPIGCSGTCRMLRLLSPLFAAVALSATVQARPRFAAPYEAFDVGAQPCAVAAGDLNGDGLPDLVVSNRGSNTLSVLLGRGDGTFEPDREFGTGSSPVSVAIADVDLDARPDLLVANRGTTTVSALLGHGDGTFEPKADTDVGTWITSIAIADLNGDGRPDLIAANQGQTGLVSVLLGGGNGSFAPRNEFGTGRSATALAVGDVNADGRLDVAVTHSGDPDGIEGNLVTVMLGNGDGTLGAGTDHWSGGSEPVSVVIADLDTDGRPDLAVANNTYSSSSVSLMFGNGDGTFRHGGAYRTASGPNAVVVGDFDGDGWKDLATTNADGDPDFYDPSVSLLLGNGDGTFKARRDVETGPQPVMLAVADFDRDGRQDLAVPNLDPGQSTVSVLMGNGDGTFGTRNRLITSAYPLSLATADLDRDGQWDLVAANFGTVSMRGGYGDGTFGPGSDCSVCSGATALAIADMNLDRLPDLAVACHDISTISILRGGRGCEIWSRLDLPAGIAPRTLAIGDLNNDGRQDLVAGLAGPFTIAVWLGNGDFTFQARLDAGPPGRVNSLALADLNGDRYLDLVMCHVAPPLSANGNRVRVLLGNGNGRFEPASDHPAGHEPKHVAVRDLDVDGRQDLLALYNDHGVGAVAVLRGNGDGQFSDRAEYGVGTVGVDGLAVTDLDSDGLLDIATVGGDEYTGTLSVLPGTGPGRFGARIAHGCGPDPHALVAEDLNGDRMPDLVVGNRSMLSILLTTAENPISAGITLSHVEPAPGRVVLNWSGVGVGGLVANVYRRGAGVDWRRLGRAVPEGADGLRYEDHDVAAGARYGYRLGIVLGAREVLTAEVQVQVPEAHRLALDGLRPNPGAAGLSVAFTLVDDTPATIELFDVTGRRAFHRELGGLGAGPHVVPIRESRLPPGVYLIQLRRGADTLTKRGVVIE